jgi:predicted amidophosphoribosyltransferase
VILCLFVKPSQGAVAQTKAREGMRECPHCREWMKRNASVCPHCQRESKAWFQHEGRWWVKGDDGQDYWFNERANQWVVFARATAPAPPTR